MDRAHDFKANGINLCGIHTLCDIVFEKQLLFPETNMGKYSRVNAIRSAEFVQWFLFHSYFVIFF